MPALPNVAKVVRVDLFTASGVAARVRDRIFFQYTGPGPTVADLATLTTTLASAWSTNLAQDQVNQNTLFQVIMTDLTAPSAAQRVGTVSVPGTLVGASAGGIAAIIKFKIARRYRGGHPRLYFPGVSVNSLLSAQQFTAAYAAGLATHWQSFVNAMGTTPPTNVGTFAHVNVSYFSGFRVVTRPSLRAANIPLLRGTPVVDPVLSYSVNPFIGSQRRRYGQSP